MHDVTGSHDLTLSYPPPADIRMLPIIDMNPNDTTCLYSTLLFVEKQARLLNMETACITFDQPLWLKAVEITTSNQMNVVCRLGAFHTIMSFLGSIGTIMEGSGLTEALESVYGSVAVSHMLTGKAVARAIRGHLMIESALTVMLLQNIFSSSVDQPLQIFTADDLAQLDAMYHEVVTGKLNYNDDFLQYFLGKLNSALQHLQKTFAEYRTAQLWLQYKQYVSVLKTFITAERTADWHLHLAALMQMLNLFAATGHTHYAKSARLYLQMMTDLPSTHPWLYEKLSAGCFHSVRRSDRFWAALSTDLTIEQVMMRSLKSSGGLTHGRGMDESVRTTWVKTMHKFATVNSAMSQLTNLENASEYDDHVDLGRSRRRRDFDDVTKLLQWFEDRNPFSLRDKRLHSLASGRAAADSDEITCDSAESVGLKIMKKMDGLPFKEVVLKKADRAKTLAQVNSKSVVGDQKLAIDGNILFSRLIIIMQRSSNMEPYFQYELTAEPCALFKNSVMRKADKAVLAKELKKHVKGTCVVPAQTYVVDGGWLLHRVKWLRGCLYSDILQQYIQYIENHFGKYATILQ